MQERNWKSVSDELSSVECFYFFIPLFFEEKARIFVVLGKQITILKDKLKPIGSAKKIWKIIKNNWFLLLFLAFIWNANKTEA